MRNIWLLPDTEQTGEIKALENESLTPLHEAIDLGLLPKFFVLGIPESIVRENQDPDFMYAQYARIEDGKSVFSCSKRAGIDKSGRTIVLTNLQIINSGEHAIFPPPASVGVSQEIKNYMESFENKDASSVSDITLMLNAVDSSAGLKSFASARSVHAVNKPQWVPPRKKWEASSSH